MTSARVSGLLVLAASLWGGLVVLLGPTFDFETRGTPKAWVWSENHLTLGLAAALAGIVGGLIMTAARSWALARLGALLALAGGLWFALAPELERLWLAHSLGASGALGATGSTTQRALESIAYFYGTGAVIVLLAALALGTLATAPSPASAPAARAVESTARTRFQRPSTA